MVFLVGASKDATASELANEALSLSEVAASDSAAAQDAFLPEQQESEPSFLSIDGIAVDADYTLYKNSTTYLSVVDFAAAMDPDAQVTWTGNGVIVSTEQLTLTAKIGDIYVVANGRYLYVKDGVILHEDSTMLPAAVLAKAFDAQLVWNDDTATIDIYRGGGALESGETFYQEDEVYWLSHIINAESGNQPMTGQIAVGNVILNRVQSSRFPNTIYTVIFQKNQFSPASSGAIYRDPNESSIIAAKLVLDGASVMDNALYFNRVGLNCWAARNKTLLATIGGHAFYG